MKKQAVRYSREPRASGWRFDPKAIALSEEQLHAMEMPAVNPPGTRYLRKESAGRVRLIPQPKERRPETGHPSSGHVRLQLFVPPETRATIRKIAAQEHITLSEAVRRAVAGD